VETGRGSNGWTALMYAASGGHLSTCRCLIERGRANVEAKTPSGCTALHWACCYQGLGIVQYLVVSAKANANVTRRCGRTPLDFACHSGDLAVAQCLIESGGAHAETVDDDGKNALHLACLARDAFDLVQYLVRLKPTNIDVADWKLGYTALHWACWTRKLDTVQCLIDAGANVRAVTLQGETVLHLCCSDFEGDPIALCRYLVETYMMLDDLVVDQWGRTALHVAAASTSRHHLRVVLYMMSRYPNM
jgi:ankyrin repeat protein